jgi:N-acetylmuramoyl-L-alanine amidase
MILSINTYLIECGFMTNSGDIEKITSPAMQEKTAEIIANTVRDYFASIEEREPQSVILHSMGR